MSAYCVRLKENGEIVGVFSASSIMDLAWLVDEVCSVRETEYAAMPDGGIVWYEDGAPKVSDIYRFENDEDSEPVASITTRKPGVTEGWQLSFAGLQFREWPKAVCQTFTGHILGN